MNNAKTAVKKKINLRQPPLISGYLLTYGRTRTSSFETVSKLDYDEKKLVKGLIESILLEHDAKHWTKAIESP